MTEIGSPPREPDDCCAPTDRKRSKNTDQGVSSRRMNRPRLAKVTFKGVAVSRQNRRPAPERVSRRFLRGESRNPLSVVGNRVPEAFRAQSASWRAKFGKTHPPSDNFQSPRSPPALRRRAHPDRHEAGRPRRRRPPARSPKPFSTTRSSTLPMSVRPGIGNWTPIINRPAASSRDAAPPNA
jgi:hypothetical protein